MLKITQDSEKKKKGKKESILKAEVKIKEEFIQDFLIPSDCTPALKTNNQNSKLETDISGKETSLIVEHGSIKGEAVVKQETSMEEAGALGWAGVLGKTMSHHHDLQSCAKSPEEVSKQDIKDSLLLGQLMASVGSAEAPSVDRVSRRRRAMKLAPRTENKSRLKRRKYRPRQPREKKQASSSTKMFKRLCRKYKCYGKSNIKVHLLTHAGMSVSDDPDSCESPK